METGILNLFAEAGMLKSVLRSGWSMTGSPRQESVADHCFRCAVVGYVLARMEGADAYRVMLMALFNDIHEARIGDPHKVAHRYMDVRKAEKKAFKEQIKLLPGIIKDELRDLREEYDNQKTPESIIARDADILECLIQAKEFLDMGFDRAGKFLQKAPAHLISESAKKLWKASAEWDPCDWWQSISEFER